MGLSFRGKLIAIVATASTALIALMVASVLTSANTSRRLSEMEEKYVPKLELAPRLEARMEQLKRGFQDAVAARDSDALAATDGVEKQLFSDLAAAVPALTVGQVAALRAAIDDYYQAGFDVSRRIIAGETGERLVEGMSAMQVKQARAVDLVSSVTSFDRGELARAFQDTRQVQSTMTRVRLTTSFLCLLLVLLLSAWMSRSLIRSLSDLARGLRRFGSGDFGTPIPVGNRDEISEVAEQANQMAVNLRTARDERDRRDWVEGALAGLSREVRGELELGEVASRALGFIAPYLGVPVAALYYAGADGSFALLAEHGGAGKRPDAVPTPRRFRIGEGLVGQAALSAEITVVSDLPAEYLRVRSGLGEAAPRQLALVPLEQLGRIRGVLELGLFTAWTDRAREAALLVRETLLIAIEVANARATARDLLTETRRQAEQLAHQEEELRANNEELQAQQEELRQTNEELIEQTDILAAQRQELQRNNTELERARRDLEHKAAELTSVSAYKSQFLANMSHELRTPLNSMLLLSNLLAENEGRNLSDKQVEFAKTIHVAGKDLLRLINQVLDLAKIEAGKYDVSGAPIPIRDVVEHMRRVFQQLAIEKKLRLVVDVAADVPDILETDGQRLEQVLSNLLGNAIKFTREGEVALRVAVANGAAAGGGKETDAPIVFAVSDTGVGIAPGDQERIFAPFEQVDGATDRKYGGTGLGLSICRDLTRLLGGTLRLDSTPGRGSTFSLTLPRAWTPPPDQASARHEPVAAPRPESAAPAPAPSDAPLLIIEDDDVFAQAVADIIRGQGFECQIASDGATGIRLARERRPLGIVLDVRLPDTDGWKVMEELRLDRTTAGVPVHFVTGVSAADRGLALGAVGYLTKPATRDDVLRVLRALTGRTSDFADRILLVEDDAITSESLLRLLAGENLRVERAMNAAEASAALERERFGCMVLDLSLPDMDGLDLLAKLRERHAADMPSVMIYTARSLSKAEAKAIEAHVDAIVLKDGSSAQRLLDEVRLFTRRLKEGLGPRTPSAAARVHAAPVNLTGKRILVVDDDMRTAYALSATLRAKGAEVQVADTGQGALDELAERPDFDAVLMDIMMPEMDGLEAMRRIRRQPRFSALPVIALTAKVMKGDQEKCLEAGATAFLPKPIDGDRLLATLGGVFVAKAGNGA